MQTNITGRNPATHGAYTYPNGDTYIGSWLNGAKHGKGVYTFANGAVYEGNFVNDNMSGDGTLYENGNRDNVYNGRDGKQRRVLQARKN